MKWGFLGFGRIALKFLSSLNHVDGEVCYAIASRSNAHTLQEKYPDYKVYHDYEDLCKDPHVDIVYVSTTHNFHYRLVMMALEYGKHVVCEKPMGTSLAQTNEMIELARSRNLFLLEALWMRFLPAYRKAMSLLPEIGEIWLVKANFAFKSNEHSPDRLLNPILAAGSVYDVGVYPIALITDIFPEKPDNIFSHGHMSAQSIDLSCSSIWRYPEGQLAEFFSSVYVDTRHDAFIYGDEGYIKMDVFWKCQRFEFWKGGNVDVYEIPFEDTGFVHEIREAVKCVREGKIESPTFSHADSLRSAEIVDQILVQIGYERIF